MANIRLTDDEFIELRDEVNRLLFIQRRLDTATVAHRSSTANGVAIDLRTFIENMMTNKTKDADA